MHPDNNTIMLADTKGVYVIDIRSIIRIEAVSNYSKLFLTDGRSIMVSKVLKRMETMLAGKGFERIHRSHVVNTACIQRYNLYHLKITLHNQEEISISRRRGTYIRKKLSDRRDAYINKEETINA